jgi:hypothetical protein
MSRCIFSIFALACLAQAQEYRSTLTGRITDPTGAAVPNAKVTATKTDTNSRFPTVSGPEGRCTIPLLPPGTFELTAEVQAFKKHVQSGIEIASNVRITVDVQLTLGNTSESVTVTEDAPPLITASASPGQAVTTRQVENLPINGRAPMDLAVMAYGVVNTGVRDQNRPYENSGFSTFSMGGAANGANEMLMDGVPNVGTLGTASRHAAFSPPVDAVSEVKVEVFNVDASYGGEQPGTCVCAAQCLLRLARDSEIDCRPIAQPAEPPGTDPYAGRCDRESWRRPTYVDSGLRRAAASRTIIVPAATPV